MKHRKPLLLALGVTILAGCLWLERDRLVDTSAGHRAKGSGVGPGRATQTAKADPDGKHTAVKRGVETITLPDLSDLDTRQAFYDQLRGLDSIQLWQQWTAYLDSGERSVQIAWMLTGEALARQLRHSVPAGLLAEFSEALDAPDASPALREQLPLILARAATPETLKLLLDKSLAEPDREQRYLYQESVMLAANTRWEDRFHVELAPPLLDAWNSARRRDDRIELNTLAGAIARVGSSEGIAMLLETLALGGGTLEALNDNKEPPVVAAAQALAQVRNPAAVGLLQAQLTDYQPDSPVFLASGNALANIGGAAATKALLDWAGGAPDDATDLVVRWFDRLRDTESRQLVATRLRQDTFRSDRVRDVIRRSLEATHLRIKVRPPSTP